MANRLTAQRTKVKLKLELSTDKRPKGSRTLAGRDWSVTKLVKRKDVARDIGTFIVSI